MGYKNIEDQRACDREWKRQYRRDHPEEVRAADRARHQRRTPEQLASRRANHNEWCTTHKERRQSTRLKSRYGITLKQYNEILEAQGGVCAICKRPPGERPLFVDHDHVTKKVRGLLHHKCNSGLGQFDDDPDLLEAAATYLRSRK